MQPYAISRDSPWTHVAWMQALDLDFPLLSDWNAEATRGFGVAFDFRGLKTSPSGRRSSSTATASSAAPGPTTRRSCPTSTSCSRRRGPCSRPADRLYWRHGNLCSQLQPKPARRARSRRCSAGIVLVVAVVFISQASWYNAWYSAFKAVHVIAAVIWVGGGALLMILGIAAERKRRPGRARHRRPSGRDGRREALRAGGHRRRRDGRRDDGQHRLGLGQVLGHRRARRLRDHVRDRRRRALPDDEEDRRAHRRERPERIRRPPRRSRACCRSCAIDIAMLLLVVVDMVVKPFS